MVTFRHGDGREATAEVRGNKMAFDPRDFSWPKNVYVRQPDCDGLKLSGTYQRSDIGHVAITFTPDGRFVDQGLMHYLPLNNIRPAAGSGTYAIKNYTLTLRYDHGAVLRILFHRERPDREESDLGTIYIDVFPLIRQGEMPATARLPNIEAPAGWKSQYDAAQTQTIMVPPNLPPGRTVLVGVTDPVNRNTSQSPDGFHDAVVQGLAKGYSSQGMRTEKAMRRLDVGIVSSSSGVFVTADAKQWWITIFTVVSASEGRAILLVTSHEDLHNAYLPPVRAMLGDVRFYSGAGQ
jgi:hypothetical protein